MFGNSLDFEKLRGAILGEDGEMNKHVLKEHLILFSQGNPRTEGPLAP
jgi:hypothetical protein